MADEKTVLTKTLQDDNGNLIAPRTYANAVVYKGNTVDSVLDNVLSVPVTSSDNGKFLQVVDGEWAAVEIQDGNTTQF